LKTEERTSSRRYKKKSYSLFSTRNCGLGDRPAELATVASPSCY